jgi:glyoxylase-like metal-dependent hydrolase (beta-lactamase superfamily II)
VSGRGGPPTIAAAGWAVTQLDVGAIFAPLTWVFPDAAEDETAWLPSNALLCRRGDAAVLLDCGLGPFTDIFDLPIRHVDLAAALASAGCPAELVSTVVLTHLDADHAGGIVAGDPAGTLHPAFPHARVVMLDAAHDVLEGCTAQRSELAETIGATLHQAGVEIAAVGDGAEVAAGIRLRSAPGHRAGHACVELSGDGEAFVYLADIVHAREHVAHPEWDFLHDSEPEVALETRGAAIAALAGSGAIVACSHVDGFGQIDRAADGSAQWVDVE